MFVHKLRINQKWCRYGTRLESWFNVVCHAILHLNYSRFDQPCNNYRKSYLRKREKNQKEWTRRNRSSYLDGFRNDARYEHFSNWRNLRARSICPRRKHVWLVVNKSRFLNFCLFKLIDRRIQQFHIVIIPRLTRLIIIRLIRKFLLKLIRILNKFILSNLL